MARNRESGGTPSTHEARAAALRAVDLAALRIGRHLSLIAGTGHKQAGQLDRVSYTILIRLADDPLTLKDLSHVLGVDISTVNRRTARLVRSGMLERFTDPEGRLVRRFRLTDAGQRLLARERQANLQGIGIALKDWSADDLEDLTRLLDRLNSSLEDASGLRWKV
ncbi:MAG: MarR family transcriptional regulator [Pseudoclavibacter sp.]